MQPSFLRRCAWRYCCSAFRPRSCVTTLQPTRNVLRADKHRDFNSWPPITIQRNGSKSVHSASSVSDVDTIYALSTASGRAAIAVIRISGPACLRIYDQLCPGRAHPKPRSATLRRLLSPKDRKQVLDTGALVLYFPAPNTVTGEDILELHVHGGPAIVRSVLEAVSQVSEDGLAHVRPAEAGEFTKRAFYNDRIDLAEVEALGEALVAETEQQRRLAVSGAESGLAQRYEGWRSMLLYARGELEALIDFSEDQHFDESPQEFMNSVSGQVVDLKRKMELHILNASRGELLRTGINVALLGAPNAGKSSLLNRIVGREAAIVSAEAGTTRDIVDVNVDIQGWLVRLGDMAGLRVGAEPYQTAIGHDSSVESSTVGEIEQEGIRRARERALQSDLIVVLVSLQLTADGSVELALNNELVQAVEECCQANKSIIFVLNKVDLLHNQSKMATKSISRLLSELLETFSDVSPHDVFCLSCKDADHPKPDEPDSGGLQTFIGGLTKKFQSMTSAAIGVADDGGSSTDVSPAEARSYWTASLSVTHRQSQILRECLVHLNEFLEIASPCPIDLVLEQESGVKSTIHSINPPSRSPGTGFFDTDGSHTPVLQPELHDYHIDNHEDIVGEIGNDGHLRPLSTRLVLEAKVASSNIAADSDFDIVMAAEHLRNAADCLARLTGRGDGVSSGADVEDVLGVVFEKFCVGK